MIKLPTFTSQSMLQSNTYKYNFALFLFLLLLVSSLSTTKGASLPISLLVNPHPEEALQRPRSVLKSSIFPPQLFPAQAAHRGEYVEGGGAQKVVDIDLALGTYSYVLNL